MRSIAVLSDPGRQKAGCTISYRLLALFLAFCGATVSSSQAQSPLRGQENVTFAQISDAHIFDDGWNQPVSASFRQGANDRDALEWSIQEINRLVKSGVRIDFVVYTGDLGLQNVDFPRDGICAAQPASPERGLPPFNLISALDEVVAELNLSAVREVYFIPGNNDLIGEAVTDNQRYQCFISLLKTRLLSLSPPVHLEGLDLTNSFERRGIRFAALNSASFKDLKNYYGSCAVSTGGKNELLLQGACPQSQMKLLRKLVGPSTTTPLVLFTHVPDLKDPYRQTPSWSLPDELRRRWEEEACQPNVIAILAGHFHDANRAYYGSTSGSQLLELSKCVAQKTWVAPPLAIKNQQDKAVRARGFLVVEVTSGGAVRANVHWFDDQQANPTPNRPWWKEWPAKPVLGIVLAGLIFLFLVPRNEAHAMRAALLWLAISFAVLWIAKNQFAISESTIIVTLLLLPFVAYGVLSGRLAEFTVPGGGGVKFQQVSAAAVDPSQAAIDGDQTQMQMIAKGSLESVQDRLRYVQPGKPIVLTMMVGKGANYYLSEVIQQALDTLLKIPEFKFVVFVDNLNRLVGYIPGWLLRQMFFNVSSPSGAELTQALNANNTSFVRGFPGMITASITPQTTNAEALKKMNEAGLDAIMVKEKDTQKPVGVVARDRILTSMMLALAKGVKA